jgi:GxxExxY protein
METTEFTENTEEADGFLYKKEGYALLGACFNVYKDKGSGFVEPVYHDCLLIEFALQGIPFVHEPSLQLMYRGHVLNHTYEPDFICFDKIVVELKAVSEILPEHRAQLLNYLKATGMRVGYLINFGHHPKLEFERFVL